MKDSSGVVIVLVLTILFAVPLVLWNTFVAHQMYQWFVVEPFSAVDIGFWNIAGLVTFLSWVTKYINHGETTKAQMSRFVSGFTTPAIVLLFGFIYHALAN